MKHTNLSLQLLQILIIVSFTFTIITAQHNSLSEAEKAAGFELLFNGQTIDRNLIASSASNPTDWTIDNEALKPSDHGNDLCTQKKYESFEMRIDIKTLDSTQNSGIFTRSPHNGNNAYGAGAPEYSIQGDPATCLNGNREYPCRNGDDYDMKFASRHDVYETGDVYNPTVLFFNGNFVEFWINGIKVNDYELHSDEWLQNKAAGKWANQANYGQSPDGYICIQDHGHGATNKVWFRNYKIRPFTKNSKVPSPLILFSDSTSTEVKVTLDLGMTGAEIKYTTDGSDPTQSSTLYDSSFVLPAGLKVKAAAFRHRFSRSDVAERGIEATGIIQRIDNLFFKIQGNSIIIVENGLHVVKIYNLTGKMVDTFKGIRSSIYKIKSYDVSGIYFVDVMQRDLKSRQLLVLHN